MSNISKRRREGSRTKIKSMGDHKEFLKRITKTLYYGQLPSLPVLSLPVTEISCELWSVAQRGRSLRRLHVDAAAGVARSACVSPCALVLAILYLERLNACNPDYIANASPADLFLVSLMVGNKFLQDDGEDDDVICSEWAASGGIELNHLKKLEVEFLDAIDWKVFVSDESFEAGLSWLERQVALRQAALRGFFTYGDLAASCDRELLGAALHALSRALGTLALGYVAALASLAALLASTLLTLPALQLVARSAHPAHPAQPARSLGANVVTPDLRPDRTGYLGNSTLDPSEVNLDSVVRQTIADVPECCAMWSRHREDSTRQRNWYDAIVVYDWRSLEPWWSTTSVLNWLYQSSLVDPMQRWLEKMNEYADLVARDVIGRSEGGGCDGYAGAGARCVRQALNLSKLSALLGAASDR